MTFNYCVECKEWKQTVGWFNDKPDCRTCYNLLKDKNKCLVIE